MVITKCDMVSLVCIQVLPFAYVITPNAAAVTCGTKSGATDESKCILSFYH